MGARACFQFGISAAKKRFWAAPSSASKNVLYVPLRVRIHSFFFGFLGSPQNRIFSLETKLKTRPERPGARSGQSILEFLLMLPVMVALTVVLVKANAAIQVSIVNQQHSRGQLLSLALNDPEYPTVGQFVGEFKELGLSVLVFGVGDEVLTEEVLSDPNFQPVATVQDVLRTGKTSNDRPKTSPNKRGRVRIRNTVALCTKPHSLNGGAQLVNSQNLDESDNLQFDFCRGPGSGS